MVKEVIKDTILIVPFLFVVYLILEYLETKDLHYSKYFNKYGPLFGALFGILPECSFSVVSALLFMEGHITLGTLVSVFIATSDEALPLLFMHPDLYDSMIYLIVIKMLSAILVGYLVDHFYYYKRKVMLHMTLEESNHFVYEAIIRTLKVYGYVFIMNLILSYIIQFIGEDHLKQLFMSHIYLQPVLTSLFGLIPNCSISILLVNLYAKNLLYFGSLIGGLMTNGGLGLFVLIEKKLESKTLIVLIMVMLLSAIFTAILINGLGVI